MAIGSSFNLTPTKPITVLGKKKLLPFDPNAKIVQAASLKLAVPSLAVAPPAPPAPSPGTFAVAYTQGQADAAGRVPVTLIAAGVGVLAVGAFVLLQLRKKR